MTDAANASTEARREEKEADHHPYRRPVDAATLILVDRTASIPKVLVGKRHDKVVFMPGKFVFPGGRIEPTDREMATLAALHDRHVARLMTKVRHASAAKAASFALAAIRETYEETGLMLGVPSTAPIVTPPGPWEAFAKAGIVPDLSAIHFIARAITPPKRPRRFDSRFFAADISAIAPRASGFVGADKELVELVWLPITEARRLDMPGITAIALEELQDRMASGMSYDHPAPLYRMLNKRFVREVL